MQFVVLISLYIKLAHVFMGWPDPLLKENKDIYKI